MKKGGGIHIDERISQAVRFVALFIPVLLLIYGVLIDYGVVASDNYVSYQIFFGTTIPWSILAVYQFLYPARTLSSFGVQLALYHLLALVYALFVSGFNSPFGVGWILLQLATYLYFGMRGLRFSIIVFFAAVIFDSMLYGMRNADTPLAIETILAGLSIVVTTAVIISIAERQSVAMKQVIEDRKNAAIQQDRLLTIVNNLADGFFSVNQFGVVTLHNASAVNILDTNRNLNGAKISEILELYDRDDKALNAFDLLKNTRGVTIRDDLTLTVGGEEMRVEMTFSPIRGNQQSDEKLGKDGYVVILRDITKAKSLEEERDEFISVVSHELRTPIAVAEGTMSNLQLMAERTEIKKDILMSGIEKAHEQVLYLSKMVNDLSTLSRAERGIADETEHIDVRDLAHELFNEYLPQAERRGLTLNLDLAQHLGQLTASRLYLKELLQNLVSNAIKYTHTGNVTIKAVRDDAFVTFSITDTGIGIGKTDQKKIFDKFYRSEDYRTRETGGTGLGLYVANKLARKLHTSIALKSRLNHGSTFSFDIPVEKSDA